MSFETVFERPRGVGEITLLQGLSQIRVETDLNGLPNVLNAVAKAGVSIDFVKLSPNGFSFVCSQDKTSAVETALKDLPGVSLRVKEDRTVVSVPAVNIRDEEGLIARIVQAAIRAGAQVDHIGDMHDRLLLVVNDSDAQSLKETLEQSLPRAERVVPAQFRPTELPETNFGKGIKVMKFGGTSVATPAARQRSALKVIAAKEQGYCPVVVVSAIGRKGEPYATDTLLGLLREIDPNVDIDPRESDLMLACGEIMSAAIFAHLLKTMGVPAQAFRGGQAGIRTDNVFGNARIIGVNPISLFRSVMNGYIPIVCGFQGVYVSGDGAPGGELTTLGRGGSDTTASAVGAAMSAVAVEIYTDVEGVKTADPDFVKDAPTLRQLTYDEVAEIAHLGAKVVHPRAAEIAMNSHIPLWVKSTFSDDPGTEIIGRDQLPGMRVTGITHTGKLVYLSFKMSHASAEERTALCTMIYDAVARFRVNLHMLNLGEDGTGFAVARDQYPIVRDVFDGLVAPVNGKIFLFQIGAASPEVDTQASLLEGHSEVIRVKIELNEGCTMVSVVGNEYLQQPGIFARVFKVLGDAEIPVLQTTDSTYSLSCLVPETQLHRAVKVLHEEFCPIEKS